MMKSRRLMTVAFAIVVATFAGIAGAADRLILGSRLFVSDTSGLEAARKVTIDGKESPSDIVSLSNPTLSGATLTVIANGGTSSNETYILDPQGWTANPTGYKYKGPTGGDGDPVRSATLRRSSAGAVQLRIQLKGNVGVQDLKVVPP